MRFAAPETLGGPVAEVASGTLTDPAARTTYELDLVALGEPPSGDGPRPVVAIGEVKWGRQLGMPDLDRLHQARDVLARRPGIGADDTRLLLAGAGGFTDELLTAAKRRPDVVIVDPDRLYTGA